MARSNPLKPKKSMGPIYHPDHRSDTQIATLNLLEDAVEERDRAQRLNVRLQESEERLRLALDAAHMGSWGWHITEGRVEMDARMRKLLGMGPDAPGELDMSMDTYVHPGDREAYRKALNEAADPSGTGILDIALRVVHPNGDVRALHIKGSTTFAGEPRLATTMQGVGFDVTERQQEQDELRASQQRQAFLLKLTDTLRPISDPLEVKRTASRLLGEHLGVDRAAYFDVTGEEYVVKSDYAHDLPSLVGHYPTSAFGARLIEELRAGRTVMTPDVARDDMLTEAQHNTYAEARIGAYIAVPIQQHGKVVAGCAVHTISPREWTPQEVELVQRTAERTWVLVERARAEASLRTSESRYSALFNSIDEGFCVCRVVFDTTGRPVDYLFLEVNPLFEHMTGLKDAVGRGAYEMVPDLEPIWLEKYARSAMHGERFRFEQGSKAMGRWFDVFCTPVKPWGHFALVFKDISAQRKAHDELQASESFNRSLMDASPDCVEVLDIDGHLQLMNPPGMALMEIDDLAPFLGKHWRHLWPVDVHGDVTDAIERARHGEETAFDVFCPTAKGTPKWWEVRVLPVRDRMDGPVMRILSISRDITDERQRQLHLRESEGRLRMATDTGHVGVWDWNIDTDRITWSDMLFGMFRLDPKDFGGTINDFVALVHPEDRARMSEAIQRSLEDDTLYDVEFRALRSDGATVWIHTRAQVIRDTRGRPLRMVGATVDITRSKEAEQALKLADRRKDEFLATLAHELRNPLAPLRNGLEVLSTTPDDPGAVQQISDMMMRQVDHMVHLVSDLLDVSRISRGVIELRRTKMDLHEAVRRAVEASGPMLRAKDHDLMIDAAPGPLFVHADLTRLTQVFGNLLDNACKYTPPGGSIRITSTMHEGAAEVTITDSGIGLAPADIPNVFDMFSQVDRGSAHARSGLGIGLHIVKRLVEMHGGSINVRSEGLDKGSCFTIRVPMTEPTTQAVRPAPAVSTSASLRILLADDNEDAAMMLGMVLRKAGHETLVLNSGLEALEKGEAFAPHVVILDIGMPHMDGHETCRRMRETPWGRAACTIALTGWGQNEDRARSHAAGFDHHLIKPVDRVALTAVLASVKPALSKA